MSRGTRVWFRGPQNKLVPKHHCGGCGTWNHVEGTRKRSFIIAEYVGDEFHVLAYKPETYVPPYTCPTCLTQHRETWERDSVA